MKTSLRYVLTRAFKAYSGSKRTEWLLHWPGKIAISVSQMYWTAEVAESIRDGTLKDYEKKCTRQLQKIVEKVVHSFLRPVLHCESGRFLFTS
jgi:dynein heavy chain